MLKVKEGDLDKLGLLLFERYHRVLFGFFYNKNKDVALSEDLVQNVCTHSQVQTSLSW